MSKQPIPQRMCKNTNQNRPSAHNNPYSMPIDHGGIITLTGETLRVERKLWQRLRIGAETGASAKPRQEHGDDYGLLHNRTYHHP